MEYSFTQLEIEFDKLEVELTDEGLVRLNLLSSDGKISCEGILLSDQCNHGIKLINYTTISTEMKYPVKSVLEAFKNMIVHRDYSYNGDSIIRIYRDRIEFISLGDLKVARIKLGILVLRNPNLMKVFQEIELLME